MKKLWNRKCGVEIIRCFYLLTFILCVFTFVFYIRYILVDVNGEQNIYETYALSDQKDPLYFIQQSTRNEWDKQNFLVVFGFPSLDLPSRRWRRRLQRVTCWQFPEVATKDNHFTGALLPLYLLARHQIHNFTLSSELVREAEQWQDIVMYRMNEGISNTKKVVSDNGYWGLEAEIGSSRKTFFWFQFATRYFPRVPFIGKGDDDTFLSVPRYVTDLRLLPTKRTYWGRPVHKDMDIDNKGNRVSVSYMLGYCYTLARDTAEALVSYKPMQKLVLLPYTKKTEPEFIAMNMQYEDVMVGRVLKEANFSSIYVMEGCVRFHVFTSQNITDNFIATHKPKENEYFLFVNNVMLRNISQNTTIIFKKTPDMYYVSNSD